MTLTRNGGLSKTEKDSKTNDNTLVTISKTELASIIEAIIATQTEKLINKIQILEQQVSDLRDTNVDLIKLLSDPQSKVKFQTQTVKDTFIEVDTSTSSSGDTIMESPRKEKQKNVRQNINRKREVSLNDTKNQIIIGKSKKQEKDDEILAAPKRLWLYVGRLKPKLKPNHLNNFLSKHLPNRQFTVEELRSDNNSSSFKVGADWDLQETLYSESFWPEGILIKRFRFSRPQNIGKKISK